MKVLEAKVKNLALLELDRKALDAGRVYIDHTVAIGAVVMKAVSEIGSSMCQSRRGRSATTSGRTTISWCSV